MFLVLRGVPTTLESCESTPARYRHKRLLRRRLLRAPHCGRVLGGETLLSRPWFRLILKCLAWLLFCSTARVWAGTPPTDYLIFTGVWSTVSATGLTTPTAVTGDASGNLYIVDGTQTSIIEIAAGGAQTSIGSGLSDPLGVASDSAGNLYVTSSGDSKVYKIPAGGVQTALGSGWSSPVSIALDSNGNVFVTDSNGLSKVTPGGTQTLMVAASGIQGVATDANNNIYYGDNINQQGAFLSCRRRQPRQRRYLHAACPELVCGRAE